MKKIIPMQKNVFNERTSQEIKSINNVFGEFLVNSSLYNEIEITKDNIYELADLVGGHVKIDIFCPNCGENRVFSCETIPIFWYDESGDEIMSKPLEDEIISCQRIQDMDRASLAGVTETSWTWTNTFSEEDTRLMVFKFFCAMDNTHKLDYIVITHGNKMKKIGQYPSVADLTFPELKEYRKVITKEDERELKRAIGLFASGIGVGSFVYLRRIFERILVTASQKAIEDGKVEKEQFEKAHVDEKIKMLAEYLPKSLVNNPIFYGIVSKGIHELSEEECLQAFPVMKSFILMILRQWEKIRRDEEDEKTLAASLSSIATKIK